MHAEIVSGYTAPMSGLSEEQRDWLTLATVPGVGTAHFIRLVARFHSPGAILKARRGELADVVGPKLAERITEYAGAAPIAEQERLMARAGASLISLENDGYPLRLAEIYDPPLLLFVRGTLLEEDTQCVSIVGTRRATPYGLRMAEQFGRELAMRGITVVSGCAAGIDTAAHRGAIEAGGRTIAVLGCGVDVVYPRQNEALLEQITRHGCLLSQYPMGTKPARGHFPHRNRIISGMTMGTLIVEAPIRSGALITARQAAEQGREVFAVPGQVGAAASEGPHALIRDGAKLVETVEDILVELNLPTEMQVRASRLRVDVLEPAQAGPTQTYADPSTRQASAPPGPAPPREVGSARAGQDTSPNRPPAPNPPAAPRTAPSPPPPAARSAPVVAAVQTPSDAERRVLDVLGADGAHVDEIATASSMSIAEALSSLTMLELKGLVRQFSGKRFALR